MRFLRRILMALTVGLVLYAAPAEARDARRIVAIGDLHGDHEAFLDILQAAGVANAKGRWSGGKTILIQLGDVPDRGPASLAILRDLMRLEKDAAKAGGQVIALIGNHEAMNMTGDLRYVSAAEYDAFQDAASADRREKLFAANRDTILAFYRKTDPTITEEAAKQKWFAVTPLGKIEHDIAWSRAGEIGSWVIKHPAIEKIGVTLFVHGGISVETSARSIGAVNSLIQAELARGASDAPSILTDELGPLWYRGNVQRETPAALPGGPAPPVQTPPLVEKEPAAAQGPAAAARPSISDELTQILSAYGAKRLVVAHTPNLAGIVASEQGRLIRIDTGISSVYGGVRSYLELKADQAIAWHKGADGKWVSEALPSPGETGS